MSITVLASEQFPPKIFWNRWSQQGYLCAVCGDPLDPDLRTKNYKVEGSWQAHHIEPNVQELENCACVCSACHLIVGHKGNFGGSRRADASEFTLSRTPEEALERMETQGFEADEARALRRRFREAVMRIRSDE